MTDLNARWLHVALDLNTGLSSQDRFDRLLEKIRQALKCDASALLLFREQQFIPLAINGLAKEVLGRRFTLSAHPRLEAIARAGDVVRFPADSHLTDPYDGLIPNREGQLHVHSCIGLPLLIDGNLIGAITIDAFNPSQFDELEDDDLRILSALAASGLHIALLLEKLETQPPVEQELFTERHGVFQEMIGRSEGMQALQDQIDAVANTDLSVLIMGETGVGKELVASAIHHRSARSSEQLVYLNCAALPESVAESELFGHIKGAFTGAISHRKGKFEQANGGTLFLDEVGELSLALQAKLLRALQYGDIQRVGDDRHIRVNTRIVAATNRSLHDEVKAGRFRADLYHRLSVFPLFVPPLRERGDDVILLAGFFAERARQKLGIKSIRLSEQLLSELRQYQWPGNVRELEHVINRSAVLARASHGSGDLLLQTLQLELQDINPMDATTAVEPSASVAFDAFDADLKTATEQFQKMFIQQKLNQHADNWSAAARDLGVDNGNLHRLAKRLGLK